MTAEVPADPAGTWGQVSALSYSPPPPLPPPLCTPSPPPHPTPPPALFCPRKTSIAGCRCRGLWWTLAHSPSIDRPAKSIFSSPLTSCLGVWARERGREREERDRGRRRETEQGLRAVQLEGKNMDSECVRVCVWEVERSGEDLGNKRTVSAVCRGAEATHECLQQLLTWTHTHTHTPRRSQSYAYHSEQTLTVLKQSSSREHSQMSGCEHTKAPAVRMHSPVFVSSFESLFSSLEQDHWGGISNSASIYSICVNLLP